MNFLGLMIKKAESEKALERRLVEEIQKRGGQCLKLTSQFHRGLPDRLVLLRYHTTAFVELKSTGEKPRELQMRAMAKLDGLGFRCFVVDSTEALDSLLTTLDRRLAKIDAQINAEE